MSTFNDTCQICGTGHLTTIEKMLPSIYRGITRVLPDVYSVCCECGSEQANAIQTRHNKRVMQAFKKEIDGLLTGTEIRLIRKQFDITQSQAANIFGGGPVAFSKYESDDISQSESMDKLLRVSQSVPGAFIWLARRAGETQLCKQIISKNFKIMQQNSKVPYTTLNRKLKFHQVSSTNDSYYSTQQLAVG
ncbi:type II toxin-antitoxin system MqsA family antitoxin [Shewanella baltica]|uniref:type II toxin-antitoxin system MqsA family antitoxin n=1 Tax=Shewanella baltica TaxID=62322 RepID=UPI0030CF51EE